MNWWFFVDLAEFRKIFSKAKRIAILTGAGVSAESGVPTFRGAGGYWRKWQAQVCNIAIRLHRSVCTNYWLLMYWSIWNGYVERLTGAPVIIKHCIEQQNKQYSPQSIASNMVEYTVKAFVWQNIPLSHAFITWHYCPLDADPWKKHLILALLPFYHCCM